MTRVVQIAACILVGIGGWVLGGYLSPPTGLRGHYYTNQSLTGQPIAVTLDRNASTEVLRTGTAAVWTSYAVEWTGAIAIPAAGRYVFTTISDDGSELDINDTAVVRNGGLHGPKEASGTIDLPAGIHRLRVRYVQAGGGFQLDLKYGLEGQALAPIPSEVLLPEPMSYAAYRARSAIPMLSAALAVVALLTLIARQRFRVGGSDAAGPPLRIDNARFAIGVLLVIAVTARIAMMLGSNGILWADSEVFLATADAIRNGHWFEHDPYRTILYPYFLSPFLAASTEKPIDQVIVGAQHILGVITVVACFIVGKAAFGARVGFAAALLLAVHTTQLYYEKSILTEALFVCLLLLTLWGVLGFLRRPTLPGSVAIAVACFILTMTRPAALWFIAVPVAVTLGVAATWRRRVVYATVMGLVYVAALVPWMAVNERTYGFRGVALGQGLGLFIRTAQIERFEPSLYAGYPDIEELLVFARTTQSAAGHVMDGLRRRGYSTAKADDLLYRASLSAIAHRPWQFTTGTVRQWWLQLGSLDDEDICTTAEGAYICSDRTIGFAREPFLNRPLNATHQPLRPLVVGYFRCCRIPMHAISALAMFGAVASVASVAAAPPVQLARVMLALTVVYFTLLPAATQTLQDRFRLPVDGVLFMFAAFGVLSLWRAFRRSPLPAGSRE